MGQDRLHWPPWLSDYQSNGLAFLPVPRNGRFKNGGWSFLAIGMFSDDDLEERSDGRMVSLLGVVAAIVAPVCSCLI